MLESNPGLLTSVEGSQRGHERSSRNGSDASNSDVATAREIDSLKRDVERLKSELIGEKNTVLARVKPHPQIPYSLVYM